MTNSTAPTLTLDATAIVQDLALRITEIRAEKFDAEQNHITSIERGLQNAATHYEAQYLTANGKLAEFWLMAKRWGIESLVENHLVVLEEKGEVA